MKDLTKEQAADIARKHGLNLTDAMAIHSLADTEKEAETLAEKFSVKNNPTADELLASIPRMGSPYVAEGE